METVIASDAQTRDAVYRFRQSLASNCVLPVDVLAGDYGTATAIGLQDMLDPFAIVAAAIDRSTDTIVGAVRTNYLRESSIPLYPELYRLGDLPASTWMQSSITSCWTMAPQFACADAKSLTHPAMLLAWTLYDLAMRQRICHDFLDCSDAELAFFTQLGYQRLGEIVHPVRGRSNLMRLDVYDWIHLADIKSPFLTLARGVAS